MNCFIFVPPAIHEYLTLDNIYWMKELKVVPPSLLPFLSFFNNTYRLPTMRQPLFYALGIQQKTKQTSFLISWNFILVYMYVGWGDRQKNKWINKKIWGDYRCYNVKMHCMQNEKGMIKRLFQVGGSEIWGDDIWAETRMTRSHFFFWGKGILGRRNS